jgi:hypothetical protein
VNIVAYARGSGMIEAENKRVRQAVLVALVGGCAYLGDSIVFSVIAALIFYGLWVAVVKLFVSRSRFVGGVALLFLSAVPLLVGIAVWWVGIIGLGVFTHGTLLALTGSARLDYD